MVKFPVFTLCYNWCIWSMLFSHWETAGLDRTGSRHKRSLKAPGHFFLLVLSRCFNLLFSLRAPKRLELALGPENNLYWLFTFRKMSKHQQTQSRHMDSYKKNTNYFLHLRLLLYVYWEITGKNENIEYVQNKSVIWSIRGLKLYVKENVMKHKLPPQNKLALLP